MLLSLLNWGGVRVSTHKLGCKYMILEYILQAIVSQEICFLA